MPDLILALNFPAMFLAWIVVLMWIGVVTYLIDQIGVVYGWWKNDN